MRKKIPYIPVLKRKYSLLSEFDDKLLYFVEVWISSPAESDGYTIFFNDLKEANKYAKKVSKLKRDQMVRVFTIPIGLDWSKSVLVEKSKKIKDKLK